VLAWGVLLLKFYFAKQIDILLHPDYTWLTVSGGIALLLLGGLKGWSLWSRQRSTQSTTPAQHANRFRPSWSSALLLVVALVGLGFTPRPFASQVAMERGVTDTLTLTRSQPQTFRGTDVPTEKSLIDWVRTLGVYPEPDAYAGKAARVDGFVIYRSDLPDDYLMISRFVITCCAADVYPVGLPVKLTQSRSRYPADQWFRIEGKMITETLAGQRQLVIQASSLTEIPEPENPYEY
jgi:uncharacterized repeat protein (TIGR03943 family)